MHERARTRARTCTRSILRDAARARAAVARDAPPSVFCHTNAAVRDKSWQAADQKLARAKALIGKCATLESIAAEVRTSSSEACQALKFAAVEQQTASRQHWFRMYCSCEGLKESSPACSRLLLMILGDFLLEPGASLGLLVLARSACIAHCVPAAYSFGIARAGVADGRGVLKVASSMKRKCGGALECEGRL
eukprot:2332896-Pleurochrysis_carterae.AAC.1